MTLYDRIGGEGAVFAVATLLYERILADPLIAPFFTGLDIEAVIRKQVAFLCWAFGANSKYEYRPLEEAHRDLVRQGGLADVHFDAVVAHLTAVLRDLRVEPSLIDEVMTVIASTRRAVLGG